MVAQACNSSTWEVDGGESGVQGQPELYETQKENKKTKKMQPANQKSPHMIYLETIFELYFYV